jgi:hypothetical protein
MVYLPVCPSNCSSICQHPQRRSLRRRELMPLAALPVQQGEPRWRRAERWRRYQAAQRGGRPGGDGACKDRLEDEVLSRSFSDRQLPIQWVLYRVRGGALHGPGSCRQSCQGTWLPR